MCKVGNVGDCNFFENVDEKFVGKRSNWVRGWFCVFDVWCERFYLKSREVGY